MVARIKDSTLRDEYARQLAGWVGWDDVAQVVGTGARNQAKGGGRRAIGPARRCADRPARAAAAVARPDPRDPTLWPQREALKSALQYPALAGPVFDSLTVESFTHPGYAAVRAAIDGGRRHLGRRLGRGVDRGGAPADRHRRRPQAWSTSSAWKSISVEDDDKLPRYISGVLARLQEVWVGRQIAEVKSKLQRMSPVEQGDEYHALFGDLVAMEAYRRSLLEQASGDDLTA